MRKRGFAILLGWLAATTAQAAIPINPVTDPIAPGVTVGLSFFGKAQATGSIAANNFDTRIQQLQPVPDGSGRLFVNDTRGTISVVGAAGGTPQTWFDARTAIPGFSNATNTGQTGLMGFAFHPNFAGDPQKPGYGVFYTIDTSRPTGTETLKGNGTTVDHDNIVHEFHVTDPTAAVPEISAPREVLRIAQSGSDHGAGTIAFNPNATPGTDDYGKLYIGMGDGGGGEGDPNANAQDLGSAFGKILRIDPAEGPAGQAYTIPTDNPHLNEAGALPEVWASGLRNPQSFSWDKDGTMLIADIGASALEEVNVGVRGANYGWPVREGTFVRDDNDPHAGDTGFTDPIAQYDHEEIFRSGQFDLSAISGVYAYQGSAIPELAGMTVLSDLVSGRLFYYDSAFAGPGTAILHELGLSLNGMDTTMTALDGNPYLGGRVDLRLGTDGNGELYLLSKTFGDIYRLTGLATVPEPASWAMMVLGFGFLGGALRRQRSAVPA